MDFDDFNKTFTAHAAKLLESNSLFLTDIDPEVMWTTYLESYPPHANKMFRKRREMDCSCCRHFIKRYGNIVSIRDNEVVTLWDFHTDDDKFEPMIRAMEALIRASVKDVFMSRFDKLGTFKSEELLESGRVHTWHHFFLPLPNRFVVPSGKTVPEVTGAYRDTRNVFKRSLEEISQDAVQAVLDMIDEKSLYRGEEWQAVLRQFLGLQKEYGKLKGEKKENYCWIKSTELGGAVTRIRNHSIGTLLLDLTGDVDADAAVRKYEAMVAPTNYKRPKAIFTKKMVEDAQKKVAELGLSNALGRRHATLSDISVNNVLWVNRDAAKVMLGDADVFNALKDEVAVDPRKLANLKSIGIDEFLKKLSSASVLEVLLENKHEANLMSVIAPKDPEAPSLFKWDNPFSWAYNGNITDSMKQLVKEKGGNVEGVLRFSLQWNTQGDNLNDYDAHCIEPNENHIYFGNKRVVHASTGVLDVDIINPVGVAVENITWSNLKRMPKGVYRFSVHNYTHRGGRSGFDAEVEFDGELYEFAYHKDLPNKQEVLVAEVGFDGTHFKLGKCLDHSTTGKTLWGLQTQQFQPVSTFMYSPNYWDGQGVGNRHYFFLLANCRNNTSPNGFYNEFLKEDLTPHRKVFEALGAKLKVEPTENQLSGLGFSSTKHDALIAKVDGKLIKIVF